MSSCVCFRSWQLFAATFCWTQWSPVCLPCFQRSHALSYRTNCCEEYYCGILLKQPGQLLSVDSVLCSHKAVWQASWLSLEITHIFLNLETQIHLFYLLIPGLVKSANNKNNREWLALDERFSQLNMLLLHLAVHYLKENTPNFSLPSYSLSAWRHFCINQTLVVLSNTTNEWNHIDSKKFLRSVKKRDFSQQKLFFLFLRVSQM